VTKPPAVAFERLAFAYHPGHPVFQGYSASSAPGEIMAILGQNGRGKTTLLKLLLGMLRPTEGKITTHGHLAFVPQLFQVSFDYSVLEMVLMGCAQRLRLFAQPSARDEAAALETLDRFGLAALAERPFHELSGGQRQMTIFARALVSQASILLLDEPTAALDLKNQGVILEWISRLARHDGLTILFTTHQPAQALAVADHALLMNSACDCRFGPASAVLTEPNLQALYGVPLKRLGFEHGGKRHETFAPVLL
jgi:iron complex transport system ATP-binding protein